jgi:hypothetical protein
MLSSILKALHKLNKAPGLVDASGSAQFMLKGHSWISHPVTTNVTRRQVKPRLWWYDFLMTKRLHLSSFLLFATCLVAGAPALATKATHAPLRKKDMQALVELSDIILVVKKSEPFGAPTLSGEKAPHQSTASRTLYKILVEEVLRNRLPGTLSAGPLTISDPNPTSPHALKPYRPEALYPKAPDRFIVFLNGQKELVTGNAWESLDQLNEVKRLIAAPASSPSQHEISSVEEAYQVYIAWHTRLTDKSDEATAVPNGKELGAPQVTKLPASAAIVRAQGILTNTPESLVFGSLQNLPKHGTLWLVEFPNVLHGGSLTFIDSKTGEVLLSLQILEG